MDEQDYRQKEWENDNTLEELDMLDEDEGSGRGRRSKTAFKIVAVIILLAFLAFSYAWLPVLKQARFDFLKQDEILSEEDLVIRCKPAVVNIEVSDAKGTARSIQGTGVNLEPQGMIITNRHVIEGASSVEVIFSDEKRYFSREIEMIDGYDLAVIKLNAKDLPFLPVVTEGMAELGQVVTVIGNPLGINRVSSRGEVKEYIKTDIGMPAFTISTAIAPGSSGSPVLDETGSLVGIIFAMGTVNINDEKHERALAIPATALDKYYQQKN